MKGKIFVWTCQSSCFVGLVFFFSFTCLAQQAAISHTKAQAASATGSINDQLRQAREAIEKLDFSRAETILVGLLKSEPKSGEANLLLGRVLYLQGRYEDAIEQLNKIALPPEASELLKPKMKLLLGWAYFKEGSKNLAAENYEEAELIAQDLLDKDAEFEQMLREARAGLEFLDWIAYRTDRFTFYYPRFSIIRERVPQFAERVEKALEGVVKTIGETEAAPEIRIDFYIYNGEQHGRDVLGKPPGFGDPITRTIHASYTDPPGKHLISVVWPYLAKKTGKHLPRRTLLTESILDAIEATASRANPAEQAQPAPFRQRKKDAEAAALLLDGGKLPSLGELLRESTKPTDRAVPRETSIELSAAVASFTRFLAERYGEDKLRELYFKADEIHDALQEVYLKPLETLEEEWRKHVRGGDPKRSEKALLFLQLSTAYLKMELFDLAAEASEKSLAYDGENIPAYFDLIALYKKLNKFDAAIDAGARAKAAAEKPEEAEKLIQELRKEKADFQAARAKDGAEHDGELPLDVQLVRWTVEMPKPKDEKGPRFSDGNPKIAPVLCQTTNGNVACFHKHGSKEIVGFSARDGVQLWVFSPPNFPKPKKKRAPAFGYDLGGMIPGGTKIYGFYNKWEYIPRRARRTAMLVGCDVFEIDPANGEQTQRFSLKQPFLSEPANVVSTNGGEGMIVCYISGYQGKERDEICALDLCTGNVRWTQKIPAFALHGYTGAVAFLNQRAAFIGDQEGKFYGYDLLSGEKKLEFKTEGSVYASACGSDDKVFVGCSKGFMYCLDSPKGELLWKVNVGDAIVNEIRMMDGFISFTTRGNRLYCANANDGQIVWQREMPKSADRRLYASRSAKALMTMNGSRDFFGDEEPMVSVLNIADGKVRWRYEIEYEAAASLGEDVVLVSYGDVYDYDVSKAICLNLTPSAPTSKMKAAKIFKAAEREREDGDPHLGEALLKKCVELDPGSNQYLSALANAYYDNRKLDKAAEAFKKLIKRDPDNAQEYNKRLEDCYQKVEEDFEQDE